jgi:hypothetical protein
MTHFVYKMLNLILRFMIISQKNHQILIKNITIFGFSNKKKKKRVNLVSWFPGTDPRVNDVLAHVCKG